eukprot:TRINITY_DN31434_c0_g1_i2.p1 TRINITY_DN31434_c0_g1~~TRINITY_DN31434_c0_g1_i2.p1  ORF type:complete len:266 (-),score=51.45 TRINITY_DN31434_c0_g1_i2:69-866(-)
MEVIGSITSKSEAASIAPSEIERTSRAEAEVPGAIGCRLLPKLIDLRSPAEVRSHAIKGAKCLNVAKAESAEEFTRWAAQRSEDAAAYGLKPMHVLLTSRGVMNQDQQKFVTAILTHGSCAVCILAGGYDSLRPFFLEPMDCAEPVALVERAQDAKELLQKGIGNLRTLWQKTPSRQQVMQRLTAESMVAGTKGSTDRTSHASAQAAEGATFQRAPLQDLDAFFTDRSASVSADNASFTPTHLAQAQGYGDPPEQQSPTGLTGPP